MSDRETLADRYTAGREASAALLELAPDGSATAGVAGLRVSLESRSRSRAFGWPVVELERATE